ncbi:hypothetical protein PR202_ga27561 [Eleusine coracana subsp. coracana]|uniref:Uncharacterized protein n=1 Tax=Eleusine coracana subsp. coracana TaxID=191504 RepID=A0AAV5DH99_ELECO|nr:hypothetical protein PR202_ga27561 [Eleusine coracana subsp. coracana]
MKGHVNLKKPGHKFLVIETGDYSSNNGHPPVMKRTIFFGQEIGAADSEWLCSWPIKVWHGLGSLCMTLLYALLIKVFQGAYIDILVVLDCNVWSNFEQVALYTEDIKKMAEEQHNNFKKALEMAR